MCQCCAGGVDTVFMYLVQVQCVCEGVSMYVGMSVFCFDGCVPPLLVLVALHCLSCPRTYVRVSNGGIMRLCRYLMALIYFLHVCSDLYVCVCVCTCLVERLQCLQRSI